MTVQGVDALIAMHREYQNNTLAQCAAQGREVVEEQDKMEKILVEARASV